MVSDFADVAHAVVIGLVGVGDVDAVVAGVTDAVVVGLVGVVGVMAVVSVTVECRRKRADRAARAVAGGVVPPVVANGLDTVLVVEVVGLAVVEVRLGGDVKRGAIGPYEGARSSLRGRLFWRRRAPSSWSPTACRIGRTGALAATPPLDRRRSDRVDAQRKRRATVRGPSEARLRPTDGDDVDRRGPMVPPHVGRWTLCGDSMRQALHMLDDDISEAGPRPGPAHRERG